MTDINVATMSYAELLSLRAKLEQEIQGKRAEELKVLADGYVKKLQAAGFNIEEGIKALLPYTEAKRRRTAPKSTSHVRILYRDPANPANTWSGRGQPAKWLSQYIAAGHHRDEFRVKL